MEEHQERKSDNNNRARHLVIAFLRVEKAEKVKIKECEKIFLLYYSISRVFVIFVNEQYLSFSHVVL